MKQVRCISPHGGCLNGMTSRGEPVHPVWDGSGQWVLPDLDPASLRLAPNPGGWVQDGRIAGGFAAVGETYDVPDDFYADGFHWEDAPAGAPQSKPAPPAAPPEGE